MVYHGSHTQEQEAHGHRVGMALEGLEDASTREDHTRGEETVGRTALPMRQLY